MSQEKTYIGDAVYADRNEQGAIVLTTEDGVQVTNEIVLEPEVFNALLQWARLTGDLKGETE